MLSLIRNFAFLFLFFAFFQSSFAQNIEWRDVTAGELALKTSKVVPNSDAEYIFREMNIEYADSRRVNKYYFRIKIFTEKGRNDFSKINIPVSGEIKNFNARVIQPDNSIVAIDKKDFFDKTIAQTKYFIEKEKSFAIPNLQIGSIIEYRYDENFPLLERTVRVIRFSPIEFNFTFQFDIPAQRISYSIKLDGGKEKWQIIPHNFQNLETTGDEKSSNYVFTRYNVPPIVKEAFMPPENLINQYLTIINEPRKVKNFEEIMSEAVGYYVYRFKFIQEYAKDRKVSEKAKILTADASTDEEKIRRLYNFCQKQIISLQFDETISQKLYEDPDDILKNQIASSYQVNNLFAGLAASLGFEPQIILGYDRRKYVYDEQHPEETPFKSVAVSLKIANEWRYFDPSNPFLPFGSLPWFNEGIAALRMNNKLVSFINIPLATFDKNKSVRTGEFTLTEDGALEGFLKIEYHGYLDVNAKTLRANKTPAERESDVISEIKQRISTAEVSEINFENIDEVDEHFTVSCKIRVPNYAQKTGKRLLFQPSFFEFNKPSLFANNTRFSPIFFPFPWSEDDAIVFNLPKNYSLETPEPSRFFADPEQISMLTTKLIVNEEQNKLKFERRFYFGKFQKTLFQTKAYNSLKTLFDSFQQADSRVLILREK